jgi:hypothetical protein
MDDFLALRFSIPFLPGVAFLFFIGVLAPPESISMAEHPVVSCTISKEYEKLCNTHCPQYCLRMASHRQEHLPSLSVKPKPGIAFKSRLPSATWSASSISISFLASEGFGCDASSSNFAERRSVLADSTGPKTFFLSRWLFDLTLLARALFAMVV